MPSLATTSKGPLGCGAYTVRFVNDGVPILESRRVTSVVWSRRLDEVSTATIAIPVGGTDREACCEGAALIQTLRTEVIVERNGLAVWQGWVMRDVTFTRDTILVNAHDILMWTERRTLKQNHTHVNVDLTSIALDYFADINSTGDLPFQIDSTLTGVLGTRTVLASEDKFASEALGELYGTGLDVTVVAGAILLGPETTTCLAQVLRDTDFDGSPEIKLDGAQRASRVVVRGGNGIRAIYPPDPPPPPPGCFHAADIVVTDEQILDLVSAQHRAQELYELASTSHPYFVNIPQGSGLNPDAPVHINALIPGRVFQFYSQSLCLRIAMAIKLVAVDVEAASGSEQVRVSFEPLGDDA